LLSLRINLLKLWFYLRLYIFHYTTLFRSSSAPSRSVARRSCPLSAVSHCCTLTSIEWSASSLLANDSFTCARTRYFCDASSTFRSEEHTSELQSLAYLLCFLLLENKKTNM